MKIIFSIMICLTLAYTAKGQKFATPEVWSSTPLLGSAAVHSSIGTRTFVADVDGDGKNDIIAIKTNGIFVKRSNGCTFTNDELWLSGSFGGSNDYDEYKLADVNGDGAADLIKYNYDDMSVKLSNGSTFESSQWTVWLSGDYKVAGSRDRGWFADVNGDGKKDYVRILYGLGTYVFLSTGSNFMPGTKWGTKAYMESGLFADADGDGKADIVDELIMNGTSQAYFFRSLGDKFSTSSSGSLETEDNINAYAFADFTGDGRVDILFKEDNLMIKRSTGDSFSNYETWQYGNDLDNNYNYFADVTGDGRADIIMLSQNDVRVKRTINNCYITGPDLVCSSGSIYTVNNLPPVDSIVWICGPNLAVSSGQNTSIGTISATGSGEYSSVSVRLVTACGSDVTLPEKIVWAGYDVDFNGLNGVAIGLPGVWTADISCGTEPFNYQWYITQPGENERACGTNSPTFQLSIKTPSLVPETYYLRLAASDAARHLGTTSAYGHPILVYGTLFPFFIEYTLLVSPNPSSGEVTITIESTAPEAKSSITNDDWDLEVYDQGQKLKTKKTKVKGKGTTLNTSGWKEGVYIIKANYKGEVLTEKLLIIKK